MRPLPTVMDLLPAALLLPVGCLCGPTDNCSAPATRCCIANPVGMNLLSAADLFLAALALVHAVAGHSEIFIPVLV